MATRQISIVCSLVLRYVRCELPEDTVDIMVKVRTMKGMHILKEDRDNHTLNFRPWIVRTKPFEALRVRLNRYVKWEKLTTAATTSVAPFEQSLNKERRGDVNG